MMSEISIVGFNKLLSNANDTIKLLRNRDAELGDYMDFIKEVRGWLRLIKPGLEHKQIFKDIATKANGFLEDEAPARALPKMYKIVTEHLANDGDLNSPPISRAMDELKREELTLVRFMTSVTFIAAIAKDLGNGKITLAAPQKGRE